MENSKDCRAWCWALKSGRLLISLILFHASLASCLDHTRDWMTCSSNSHNSGTSILQSDNGTCPLASDWSPWSQEPFCLDPQEEDEESDPTDCVFTLTAFRGNQGISLITTPDLAASIVEYLDDSRMSDDMKRQISDSNQSAHNEAAAYQIQDLPGRGKGLVARRRFTKHETIMTGYPMLVIRLDFINHDRYTQRQKRLMMERGVRQLPLEQRKYVRALARSTGGDPILDALRTNGFGIEIEGVQHLGLFTDGSRVNHNCRPNSFWRYVKGSMAMEVVALRGIRAGEEVAHSYAPLGHTYEERKAVLQAWGFRCRCALCSAPPAEREVSDARRERLIEIYRTLGQAGSLFSRRISELVLEAMKVIEEEELHPQVVEYYQQFAKAYIMSEDLERARHFVAEADSMWRVYGGDDHENVDGIRELWQSLQEAEAEMGEVE